MFTPGFNAVVAERAPDSTDQDSRNARGKSTLLAILNFVLGGTFDKKMQLLADNGWEFTLELQLFGGTVSATRALAAGKKLHVTATGDAEAFIAPYLAEGQITVEEWKELLGLGLFRLEPSEEKVTGGISVRTLLSYVIRTEAPKDPLKIVAVQSATSSREHIAFLLDLDWTVVLDLANVDRGLQQLKTISAAARDGLVTTLRPESDLALERAALLNEVEEWEGRIEGFRILEDPNSLVQRADELTAQISVLRDEAVVDGRMRSLYVSSLADDTDAPATAVDVEVLFAAAGAVLADGFVRQMRDVAAFHASLLMNRRAFLHSEIDSLDGRIAVRKAELSRLDEQRAGTLRTLDAGGALDELNALRNELATVQAHLAAVDLQIEQARELVTTREDLKLQQSTLRKGASEQLAGSRQKLDHVGAQFSQKMHRLYGKDAALTVEVDNAGYKFTVTVPGSGSSGVDRMKLFCFDLTLLEEGAASARHPDFLVHDSVVFDGVDPRQLANALRSAQEMVQTTGGQYICTINSNDIPPDVLEEPWFKGGIVRSILDTEVGGLLGREF
ncbi:DUF2326 domain-containing protein [Curtobacterium sp. ISL-83]|uniref:DUF2326 domain-containing protein n=1 Tax=Curtobacterium sp. ISL-83 TaxID=2819145 RepID=UPI001BE84AA5|nr:DUF2326 domain-containing protein [Curtobacterium sp. ISL-83]MBT2501780.1 DUF2326 domain-containing protein [Curtobacterium sp. ISL-83]